MPLLHGKQITNASIILNKLSGTGSLVIQTGATLQLPTANIINPTDVVNKQYVDNVATGMNPHAAVKTATTGNLALATATASPVISGYTVSTNDRVLVWQQSVTASNGIYVYTGTTFSRASDMDGQPNTEVSVGDYTFVVDGSYAGNGYVIVTSGTYSSILEPIDVAPIVWSQFTGPGQFTWNNGLINTANVIDVDIAPASGLTFASGQLTVNPTIAGNGLAIASGILSVNTANGLTIVADNVELAQTVAGNGLTYSSGVINVNAGTGITISGDAVAINNTGVLAGSYGAANSVNTFTVNGQGQLTTAGTVSISITSGQVTNFTASVQALASTVTAGTGITVSNSGGNATVSIANTGVVAGSYGAANSVNTFTVNGQGQLTTAGTVSISITSGQVTNFTASAISSVLQSANFFDTTTIDFTVGGGSVSAVVANGSLTASHLNSNGGATAGYVLSVAANGQFVWVDSASTGDITGVTAGIGLTGGGASGFVTLDVRATNGLTADATSDSVELGGTLTKDTTIVGGAFAFTQSTTSIINFNRNSGGTTFSHRIGTGISAVESRTNTEFIQARTTDANVAIRVGTNALTGGDQIAIFNSDQTLAGGDPSSNNRLVVTDTTYSKGLVYAGDYTANFTTHSLITKAYVDAISAGLGDITGVTAGDGLSGGGASGYVTLNVNTGTGLTISSDAVIIANTTVAAAAYGSATDVATFTVNAQGQLTAASNTTIAIPSSQVTNFASSVTTIVGSPVYSQRNQTPAATTGNGASSTLTISSTPNDYEHVSVYVNGQLQFLGNGTTASVDCYFGTQASTAIAIANVTSGNTLFWNGTYAGFDLAATDKVDFIYNA